MADYSIDIENELKQFLKSSGNTLDDKDISFILHFIKSKEGKITKKEFFNIWAYQIMFSNIAPETIYYEVLNGYFNDNKKSERIIEKSEKKLTKAKLTYSYIFIYNILISDILDFFGEFISEDQKEFLLEEVF